VDAHSESSIAGLFAAGECAATGLHGANRLASNSLLEAIVTAQAAAETILSRPQKKISIPAQAGLTTHVPQQAPDPYLPSIRKIASENLGILRTQTGFTNALSQLAPLRNVSDAALIAHLIATAALARTESRGAHFRTDYPGTDQAQAISQTVTLPRAQPAKRAA
jgi:L-aspartate oxidase